MPASRAISVYGRPQDRGGGGRASGRGGLPSFGRQLERLVQAFAVELGEIADQGEIHQVLDARASGATGAVAGGVGVELLCHMLLQCYHGKNRRLDLGESQQIGGGQLIGLDCQALVEWDVDVELLVAPSSQLSTDGVADCPKADCCVESGCATNIEAEEIFEINCRRARKRSNPTRFRSRISATPRAAASFFSR